jgi:ADP-ribose pyrophosphatase YjhB (NUDIX family)
MSNTPPTDDRRYPKRPLLGVGAVILDGDQILLVERGNEPLKGFWSLPGGLLEIGERLADAIRREVVEETGLEVEPVAMHEIFERIMPDKSGNPEYHYVLVDYVCRVTGGALQAASDANRAAWVPQRDLRDYRLTEGTLAVIERAFANLQRRPA